MNPALTLLLALSLAGVLIRGRWGGPPWGVLGLVATALLAPALAIPDGIPSPAADLARLAPWQATGDPEGGNPNLQDVTFQVQPWLIHLRRELRAGRLPFWNPYQYSGAPYWGNGSSAPLFPLHLLFVLLPEQLGWVLLPWLRVVMGGGGAWLLARLLGLSPAAALIPALGFPLSGMVVGFLLFPMGNALALVPWVLWAVERLVERRRGAPLLGLFVGLQLLAGHPETAVHTAMLSGLYLVVRLAAGGSAGQDWRERTSAAGRFIAGWSLGAAVAAVQIVPLAANLLHSSRWQEVEPGDTSGILLLIFAQALRIALPDLYGNPADGTWWGPFNYISTAVYTGALALPLAGAGIGRLRHWDARWWGTGAMLVFSVAAAYQLPGLRHLLLAIPVVGRGLHHRLIFGVSLTLALLAGLGWDRWVRGRGRAALSAGALISLGLLATAWWLHAAAWREHALMGEQVRWTLWVGAVAVLLAVGSWVPATVRHRGRWLAAVVLTGDLLVAHGAINPALPLSRLYPETPAIQFLQARDGRVAATGATLRPNAALVYGLHDFRGDDSVKLARYERLYGDHLGASHPTFFVPPRRWDSPWLDALGVRWVMTPPGRPAPVRGWRLAYDGLDARVWERGSAGGWLTWSGPGDASLRVLERVPGRWRIELLAPSAGDLVVAEAGAPGWRGRFDGRSVPVRTTEDLLLVVAVPRGAGALELSYRPPGVLFGCILSVAGVMGLVAAASRTWLVQARRSLR